MISPTEIFLTWLCAIIAAAVILAAFVEFVP